MPLNTYEENQILSASPLGLVRILYAAAVRAVQNARQSVRAGDIAGRSREITKAQEIVLELAASVDPSKAPEFGERLLALYGYIQAQLIAANMEQNDGPLAEVGSLLDPLQEAWAQVEEPEMAHAG